MQLAVIHNFEEYSSRTLECFRRLNCPSKQQWPHALPQRDLINTWNKLPGIPSIRNGSDPSSLLQMMSKVPTWFCNYNLFQLCQEKPWWVTEYGYKMFLRSLKSISNQSKLLLPRVCFCKCRQNVPFIFPAVLFLMDSSVPTSVT